MTKKQQEEVDFLQQFGNFAATEQEISEYIDITVHGVGKEEEDKFSQNRLRNAKQRFQVNLALWKEDLEEGLLAYWELLDDPKLSNPYAQRIIKSLCKRLDRPKWNGYETTALAVVNFNSQKWQT